jgi:TonB family protein
VLHLVIIALVLYKKKDELEVASQAPRTMKLSEFVTETASVATPAVTKNEPVAKKIIKEPKKIEKPSPFPRPRVTQAQPKKLPDSNTTHPSTVAVAPRKSSRFLEALNDNYAPPSKIQELYGDDFKALKAEQKKFIKDNLEGIGKVTQEYLYKTPLSIIKSMNGMAIVEFSREPNGDITDLRIRQSSTYTILDKHAIRTIENAYKEYPKPSVSTPIRIFVTYTIER